MDVAGPRPAQAARQQPGAANAGAGTDPISAIFGAIGKLISSIFGGLSQMAQGPNAGDQAANRASEAPQGPQRLAAGIRPRGNARHAALRRPPPHVG